MARARAREPAHPRDPRALPAALRQAVDGAAAGATPGLPARAAPTSAAKVGLSRRTKSPIYWTGIGYDLVMRALYGRATTQTYADVARRIPDGASVVDLCCGTGTPPPGLPARPRLPLPRPRLQRRLRHPRPAARASTRAGSTCSPIRSRPPTTWSCARASTTSAPGGRRARADESGGASGGRSSASRSRTSRPAHPGRPARRRLSPIPGVGEYRERFDLAGFGRSRTPRCRRVPALRGRPNALVVFPPASARSRAAV